MPDAVYESSDIDNDEDKHLAIRYGNTVGLLVEAMDQIRLAGVLEISIAAEND